MKRSEVCILIAFAVALGACTTSGSLDWRRADGSPDSQEVRDRLAKDRAECATQMGAPTTSSQGTLSYSRGIFEDCMRSRGWRRGTDPIR